MGSRSGSCCSVNETVPSLESLQLDPAPNTQANTKTQPGNNYDSNNNKKTELEEVGSMTDGTNDDVSNQKNVFSAKKKHNYFD